MKNFYGSLYLFLNHIFYNLTKSRNFFEYLLFFQLLQCTQRHDDDQYAYIQDLSEHPIESYSSSKDFFHYNYITNNINQSLIYNTNTNTNFSLSKNINTGLGVSIYDSCILSKDYILLAGKIGNEVGNHDALFMVLHNNRSILTKSLTSFINDTAFSVSCTDGYGSVSGNIYYGTFHIRVDPLKGVRFLEIFQSTYHHFKNKIANKPSSDSTVMAILSKSNLQSDFNDRLKIVETISRTKSWLSEFILDRDYAIKFLFYHLSGDIFMGLENKNIYQKYQTYLFKFNTTGGLEFVYTYDMMLPQVFNDAVSVNNEYIFLVGKSIYGHSQSAILVTMIDKNGEIIWSKEYQRDYEGLSIEKLNSKIISIKSYNSKLKKSLIFDINFDGTTKLDCIEHHNIFLKKFDKSSLFKVKFGSNIYIHDIHLRYIDNNQVFLNNYFIQNNLECDFRFIEDSINSTNVTEFPNFNYTNNSTSYPNYTTTSVNTSYFNDTLYKASIPTSLEYNYVFILVAVPSSVFLIVLCCSYYVWSICKKFKQKNKHHFNINREESCSKINDKYYNDDVKEDIPETNSDQTLTKSLTKDENKIKNVNKNLYNQLYNYDEFSKPVLKNQEYSNSPSKTNVSGIKSNTSKKTDSDVTLERLNVMRDSPNIEMTKINRDISDIMDINDVFHNPENISNNSHGIITPSPIRSNDIELNYKPNTEDRILKLIIPKVICNYTEDEDQTLLTDEGNQERDSDDEKAIELPKTNSNPNKMNPTKQKSKNSLFFKLFKSSKKNNNPKNKNNSKLFKNFFNKKNKNIKPHEISYIFEEGEGYN